MSVCIGSGAGARHQARAAWDAYPLVKQSLRLSRDLHKGDMGGG